MKSAAPKKDKAIGIRLPLETYEALKARADAERRSLSNYLQLLIDRDLESFKEETTAPGKIDVLDLLSPKPGDETRAHLDAVAREGGTIDLARLREMLTDAFIDGSKSKMLNEPPPPPYGSAKRKRR